MGIFYQPGDKELIRLRFSLIAPSLVVFLPMLFLWYAVFAEESISWPYLIGLMTYVVTLTVGFLVWRRVGLRQNEERRARRLEELGIADFVREVEAARPQRRRRRWWRPW